MPKINGDETQQMLTDTIQSAEGWTQRAVPRKELVGVQAASAVAPRKTDAEREAHFSTSFIRGKSSSGFFLLLKPSNDVDLSKNPNVLP